MSYDPVPHDLAGLQLAAVSLLALVAAVVVWFLFRKRDR
jgi:hypothetical protein